MIEIYPSILPGEPVERHDVHGITLHQWLADHVTDYRPGEPQPISATLAGRVIPPAEWPELMIAPGMVLQLRVQPKEATTWAIVAAVVSLAAQFVFKPKVPNTNRVQGNRGENISLANAEGNQPKLGGVIPENAGRSRIYPDYLSQPRRYFVDWNTQAIDLLLCVGAGEYDGLAESLRLGQTPFSVLGNDINYQIFGPGEAVTGHPAHANWYNAPEVGGTSSSSGLRLTGVEPDDRQYTGAATLGGSSLSAITVNGLWEVGMLAELSWQQSVTSSDGGTSSSNTEVVVGFDEVTGDPIYGSIGSSSPLPDILAGNFAHLAEGVTVRISSTQFLNGRYVVTSITPEKDQITLATTDGMPLTNLPLGSYQLRIDKADTRYQIMTIPSGTALTLARVLADGSADPDWGALPALTGVNVDLLVDRDGFLGAWLGPFLACPEGESTSVIEWDLLAPGGLGWIENSGAISQRQVDFVLEARPLGGSTWYQYNGYIFGNVRDQVGVTYQWTLPFTGTPEVRLRRLSAEDTRTQAMDKVEWYGLRSQLPHKTSYPGVTVLAMTLTGSDTISAQTENQVSCTPTRKLPVRSNGAWTAPTATRDIAPWAAYVAKSIGYTDAELDLAELDRLDAIWQARGDTFDLAVNRETTVRDAINQALAAGFAELTIDHGRIRPARDEPRSEWEHMYTPENMTSALVRRFQARQPDDPDGVDVEYIDETTWTKAVVECRLPGDEGRKVEKITLDGVINRTRAWRIGMRLRRRQRYRRWQYSFKTELDALNSRYLSYCPLADDVPGYGKSAWVTAVADAGGGVARLTLSEPMEWQPGADHVLAWRTPDGSTAGPYPVTPGADDFQVLVTMPQPWPDPDARQEPPHVLFGTTERWSYPALITRTNPQGLETVSVEAENYDPRVYEDDDNAPPA